jgi:hypothetical protein
LSLLHLSFPCLKQHLTSHTFPFQALPPILNHHPASAPQAITEDPEEVQNLIASFNRSQDLVHRLSASGPPWRDASMAMQVRLLPSD